VSAGRPGLGAAGRLVLLALGLALFAAILARIGWTDVARALAHVGWPAFAGLLALSLAAQLAFSEGWRAILERPPGRSALLAAYTAGDAVNMLGAGVAGEPVRTLLVADREGAAGAFVSVNVRRHADLVAQSLFLAAGLAATLALVPLPAAAAWGAVLGALGIFALLAIMTWAFRKGSYAPIVRVLGKVPFLARRLERFEPGAASVDGAIRTFEASHPGRFLASAGWSFLGWLGGLAETVILVRLLVPGASLAQAVAVEVLSMIGNSVLLFVPGRLGSAEGIRAGVFLLLGFPAAPGFAYALVRRARELVWLGAGLAVLARRHLSPFGRPRAEAGGADANPYDREA
jgi:hypothetical protein